MHSSLPTVKPVKGSPKSSTQRVRDFRDRKRKEGGTTIAMMLSPRGKASLEIIRSILGSFKSDAFEVSLFHEACRLCPTALEVQRLIDEGTLSKKNGKAWLQELASASAESKTPIDS